MLRYMTASMINSIMPCYVADRSMLFAAKVQNVLVGVLSLTSVIVSWNRLDTPEITQYLVYYTQTAKRRKRQVESLVQLSATACSVVISGLTSGRQYLFEVQAQVTLNGTVIVGPKSEGNTAIITGESEGGTGNFIF